MFVDQKKIYLILRYEFNWIVEIPFGKFIYFDYEIDTHVICLELLPFLWGNLKSGSSAYKLLSTTLLTVCVCADWIGKKYAFYFPYSPTSTCMIISLLVEIC